MISQDFSVVFRLLLGVTLFAEHAGSIRIEISPTVVVEASVVAGIALEIFRFVGEKGGCVSFHKLPGITLGHFCECNSV